MSTVHTQRKSFDGLATAVTRHNHVIDIVSLVAGVIIGLTILAIIL